ncbi:MAG: IS200/IS605 family transposase [Bacteroidetes bacterium]|nr:IS200/IS605 family transposase [Bacteroidota bacterium]
MPYTKVLLHYIWATKGRQPFITKELKSPLLQHIKAYSIDKGIFIDTMNCVEDHIHLLISLGTEQTISKVAQLIKGESAFWVNNKSGLVAKLEWQTDYIALSVSESGIDKVRHYIAGQEEHHKKKTFAQEYDDFLRVHGFDRKELG